MDERLQEIENKFNRIELFLTKLENNEPVSAADILEQEIEDLRTLTKKHQDQRAAKAVIKRQEGRTVDRYYLQDGSVYVVKRGSYRYLYDAKTKVVTYEFPNGQIERTFNNGIKEIRRRDGTVIVKSGCSEYDYLTGSNTNNTGNNSTNTGNNRPNGV